VDEEVDFTRLLQYRLQGEQYEVESASLGMEALNKVRLGVPDLILLDVMLPALDGLTLCEILRRFPGVQRVPVVIISALNSDVTRHAAAQAGARLFLSKPVDFEQLKSTIETLLKESARPAQPTADIESTIG
jgi:DNA-binding response OmpR family regulator